MLNQLCLLSYVLHKVLVKETSNSNSSANNRAGMDKIPRVVNFIMFRFLDGTALARFSQVSRIHYRYARVDSLWQVPYAGWAVHYLYHTPVATVVQEIYEKKWGELPRRNIFDKRLPFFYFVCTDVY